MKCAYARCRKVIDFKKEKLPVLDNGKYYHQGCWVEYKGRSTLTANDHNFLRRLKICWEPTPSPILHFEEDGA